VRVTGGVSRAYEYLFDKGRADWIPVYDKDEVPLPEADQAKQAGSVIAAAESARLRLPWHRVRGLEVRKSSVQASRELALWEEGPGSESFILFSLRRRS
jgi:hypothetical protein